MSLRSRIAAGATVLVVVSIFGTAATPASAAPSAAASGVVAAPAAVDLPVVGTLPDGTVFTGQLSSLTASVVNGVPTLSGLITGTGLPVAPTPFTTVITGVTAACQVLTLNLGPLNLDLLGVIVDLAPVNLLVSAVPRNIVGVLVCAIGGNGVVAVAMPIIVPLLTQVFPILGLAPATAPALPDAAA